MTLHQLEMFVAILETGSFTKAAARLYSAQPSLSQQIRNLEEELGEKLMFRMRNKKMQLTEAGEVLKKHADHILRQVQILRMEVSALSRDPAGVIRIGIGGHLLTSMLAPALRSFHETFPRIRIDIVNGTTPHIMDLLRNNTLDVGVGTLSVGTDDLRGEVLFEEELVVVVHEASRFRKRDFVNAAEIRGLSLVLFDKTTGTRRCLDDFFEREKITPNVVLELSTAEALQQMVKAGFGATIVPISSAREGPKGLRVLRIRGKPLVRKVGVVSTGYPRMPQVINTLLHLITESFPDRQIPASQA
jgi:LysR family cyn operon transcriptional activator